MASRLQGLRLPAEHPHEPHRVPVLLPLQVDRGLLQDPDRTGEVPALHLQVEELVPRPLHLLVQEVREHLHHRVPRLVRELGRAVVLGPPPPPASRAGSAGWAPRPSPRPPSAPRPWRMWRSASRTSRSNTRPSSARASAARRASFALGYPPARRAHPP